MMAGNTVYTHRDGGTYVLLMAGVAIKSDFSGKWEESVLYLSLEDDQIRGTSLARWQERFTSSEYEGDDAATLALLRRANPGDSEWDFIRVFESWGEKEANLTAVLLDLAIAATMVKCGAASVDGTGSLTITAADLRDISEDWTISREESAGGWTITIKANK